MSVAYTAERRPLVLVPQFFGATVFDRRTSRYLPFDHESADLLRRMRDVPFDTLHAQWSATDRERTAALERFFEHFSGLGFFTMDRRFAGDVLPAEPAADHLTGPLAVHLEVIASCNLTCTHCFAGELPGGNGVSRWTIWMRSSPRWPRSAVSAWA
jgi:hypothetical protein